MAQLNEKESKRQINEHMSITDISKSHLLQYFLPRCIACGSAA